jgi:hypothetical protein
MALIMYSCCDEGVVVLWVIEVTLMPTPDCFEIMELKTGSEPLVQGGNGASANCSGLIGCFVVVVVVVGVGCR